MKRNVLKSGLILVVLMGLFGLWSCSKPLPVVPFNEAEAGLNHITAEGLRKDVEFLSAPELAGRQAGTVGYNQAAEYVAHRFQEMGLKPVVGNSFYQPFTIEANTIHKAAFRAYLPTGQKLVFNLGDDFMCRGFCGSGHVTAPIVFCGYGVSSPENGYDDYADIDVDGKIVLVFKQAPSWQPKGPGWGELSVARPMANAAKAKGAVGLIMVSRPNDNPPAKVIGSVYHGPGAATPDIPQIHLQLAAARELLAGQGISLSTLQAQIDSTQAPASRDLNVTVEMNFEAEYDPAAPTMNVAAMLEGSDPELKDEYVILTAHLDHVGIQGGTLIFPGANDNASGVAGILATAHALVENPIKPRRSIIFMALSGEETGLEGAEYYAENPLVPIKQTAAQINIDCIAVGDSIEVKGGADFKALYSVATQADKAYINLKNHRTCKGGGADAEPLYQKGVPVVYFVTRNSYTHLHLPSDKVDTFDWPTFEGASKLLYLTTFGAAITDYDFR